MRGNILLELVIWAITLHQQPLKGSILFANGAVRVLKTNRLKLNFKHTTQNVIGQIDMAKLFSPKRLFDLWKVRFFKNESCTVKSRFFPYNSMQCLSFSSIVCTFRNLQRELTFMKTLYSLNYRVWRSNNNPSTSM